MEVQVVFSQQLRRFAQWLRSDLTAQSVAATSPAAMNSSRKGYSPSRVPSRPRSRSISIESMEPRFLMTADPIWVGGVYVEEDIGSDKHGDSFYVTFKGGAAGTELTRLTIDGDLNTPGFGLGDLFFDTVEAGLGADHAYGFEITKLVTADPTASVKATVVDGTTKLVLDFTNFRAGDTLVFSIDVDEVQSYDPNEKDLDVLNSGFDPITSGVEFQHSLFKPEFKAPHYEDAVGQSKFLNRYDTILTPTGLPLPADDFEGKRDRSAGAALQIQQVEKPISLAGIVYVDNNYSLTLDTGEQRLANVELELFRLENGNYVSTGFKTVTDNQGAYSFGLNLKLKPGTYQVREAQPAGYLSVGATKGFVNGTTPVGQLVAGNPDWLTTIEMPLGDMHATQLNFAEAQPASLSGRVVLVRNGMDCDDPNATLTPLAGVTVELLDTNNVVVATTITDANGNYRFNNLRAGTYTVREITPANVLEGDAEVGTIQSRTVGQAIDGSRITSIAIVGGQQGINYDFCELLPGDISGHVYVDMNDNGIRETGEAPIANVTLILWNEAGQQVGQTTTDAQGFYRFDNLPPGCYRVTELQPTAYFPGKSTPGTILNKTVGTNDATGNVLDLIKLPSGASGINYDFGELLPGSIAGRVIVDINNNCIIDAVGEMPLSGVKIELLDKNGIVLETTFTDANGNYKFVNLRAGEYRVRETQPADYFHGSQHAGSGGGDDSTEDLITSINLASGSDLVDYLFCEYPPAELSGFVFVDRDNDCLFDTGEVPIGGTRITLYDAAGNAIASTTTDSTGYYKFANLRPGTYTVREEQPAGYLHGGQLAGSHGGNDTVADAISAIVIGAGQKLVNYNFCEIVPASIAGRVFVDLNFDCIQDPNENSLSGVKVELLDAAGNVVATTFTDANGRYNFGNLRPGTYSVRESQPAGYFHGGQVAPATGGDATVDDLISGITLTPGDAVQEANFCEVPPAKISGYVYQDGPTIITPDINAIDLNTIRDGARTGDDKPIGQVRVQLRTIAGQPIDSTRALSGYYSTQFIEVLTDANGYFEFDGLRAGSYNIYQIQPTGYVDSLDTPGSTGGFSINKNQNNPSPQFQVLMQSLTQDAATNPGFDGILLVSVEPNQHSIENNFSEVIATNPPTQPPPAPPLPPSSPPPPERIYVTPEVWMTPPPMAWQPLPWSPPEMLIGLAYQAPPTWHLSVINGGTPRSKRHVDTVEDQEIAQKAKVMNLAAWQVRGMQQSRWTIVSTLHPERPATSRTVFDVPGSKPLAGDFNGDGIDELALFVDGEWFVDLNGNNAWDENDIWLRLGDETDQPVVGDWDGDGKDDVGIFGRTWSGDERALAAEPGLPDPENMRRVKAKNVPPIPEEAPDEPRYMKYRNQGIARADLIDHVFRFGTEKDVAISGDFNGDGISSIGVFQDGKWILDVDGDGQMTPDHDQQFEFGQSGDVPLVGDFDGDGIDEIAVVRSNQVIVDSNSNGRIDATDQVFLLQETNGTVVVGDFDGDGRDEPTIHQAGAQQRVLEARRR